MIVCVAAIREKDIHVHQEILKRREGSEMERIQIPEGEMRQLDESKTVRLTEKESLRAKIKSDVELFLSKSCNKVEQVPGGFVSRYKPKWAPERREAEGGT